MRGWIAVAALALLGAGAAACGEGGPRGPGTLQAAVVSPNGPEGAALVVLRGPGITGVRGAGNTRVFSVLGGAGDTVTARVVLVNTAPGDLVFAVNVEDLGAPLPTASVVEVVTPENTLRSALAGYTVTFER